MKNSIIPFLFLFFSIPTFAQDNLKAKALVQQAQTAIETGALEEAHNLFTEASEIYKQAQMWDAYAECGQFITSNLSQAGEYEMGIDIGNTFIQLAKEQKHQSIALSLIHKNIGRIYYSQDDYKKALPYLEEALKIREAINPKDPDLARDYGNLGIISRYSDRYNKAIDYLEMAISLQEDNNVLARLYTEASINYKYLGNYHKSLDMINQSIRLLENGADRTALGQAYTEKGAILTKLKQDGLDLKFLKKGLAIFESPSVADHVNAINCYKLIAYSYFQFEGTRMNDRNFLDSALVNYERALALTQQHLPPNNTSTPQILLDISSVWTRKHRFKKAESYLNSSEILLEGNIEPKSLQAAEFYRIKSDFFLWKGQYEQSLSFFQEQLMALIDDYENTDIRHLPSQDQITKSISSEKLQQALASKARCWLLYYQYGHQDKKHLEEAYKSIRLFDQLVDHMRTDFSQSGSNIAWSNLTMDAYEIGIQICLALAKATKDDSYKEQALYFSEKSKALSLLEAFNNTKAKRVAGLSESTLVQEREMKLDISELEQQVYQLAQQSGKKHEEEIQALKKKIFVKKEAYATFMKDIELNNPQYFATKYQLDILNLEQMRALLKDDQAIIEYFVGDSSLYAFKVSKTAFEVFELGGEEQIATRVKDLRNSIYGYFLHSKDRSDQMLSRFAQQYATRAYKMYQELIEPLGNLPERLIIIPAGPMSDMPFETFLMGPVSNPQQYKTHPFLLKKHCISYSYSATLLREMIEKPHVQTAGIYAGFAPTFGKDAASVIRGRVYSLTPLIYNLPEVEAIQEVLGTGVIFKGAEATEETFTSIAGDYEILHLATHGMANSTDPDFSLLAFTEVDDGKENEFLYVSDLYNLELNAEMVVLSACETALGKHFRGEGIMSLARGFSYAGAKSIFTTLWSVNDHSTYKIIKSFFVNLQLGMDKDQALRQAKLNYIELGNHFTAHPFLWGPYILVGDTNEIRDIEKGLPWTYIGFGVFGVLLLAFVGRIFMKKREMA